MALYLADYVRLANKLFHPHDKKLFIQTEDKKLRLAINASFMPTPPHEDVIASS